MWLLMCLFLSREVVLDSGLQLYCEVQGSGPPVVLISGLGNRLEAWGPLKAHLVSDHTVVGFDHRGMGRSGDIEGPYSVQTMADETAELMAKLDFNQYTAVGISLGGLVAQKLAHDHPDCVSKLVLIATTVGAANHVNPGAEVIAFFAESAMLPWAERIEKGLPYSFHPTFLEREKEKIAAWLETAKQNPVSASTIQKQSLAGMFYDGSQILPEIQIPTLVIHGQDDRIVPVENARRVHALLPQSQLAILPESGHLCILDQTDLLAKELVPFLKAGETDLPKSN